MEKNNESETVIQLDHISMHFNMASERVDGLKEYIIKAVNHKLFYSDFVAINDVSVTIKKGEVFGIVGTNGSGKSTLLKIVSGILEPTHGIVTVRGSISPLIELGAGFDGDLTARENIFLNGAILGYDRDFLEEKFSSIVDFAELWDFLDMPIKNYSSGMVARIAFAIATVVKPDILIVDEILAVGDFLFQQKCERRIRELMADGTTVLIVSHSINQIESLCDRVLWLEKGEAKMIGNTFQVCNAYKDLQNDPSRANTHEFQIVAEGCCAVCGAHAYFRNEPKMTYHSEAFCSSCGTTLRCSDMVGSYVKYLDEKSEGKLDDVAKQVKDNKILICHGRDVLATKLMDLGASVMTLEGNGTDWCEQLQNLDKIHIKKGSLDLIIFEEMSIYLMDVQSVLRKLYDLLKPGGVMLFTAPIYEKQKTVFRGKERRKIYRNARLVQVQWGSDTADILESCGFCVMPHKSHQWYKPEEQRDLDKEYEQYANTHPYFFLKFNSWNFIAKKPKER